jgi:hypothetical protein
VLCVYSLHICFDFLKISSIVNIADKELDVIEMAVYGDVLRPGKECRCKTVAELLGQSKSKDGKAACELPS